MVDIEAPETSQMIGALFTDGSCSGGDTLTKFARAGWAVVQVVHGTGELVKALFGPVWKSFPQSAQAGEWLAAAAAYQGADEGDCSLDIDCQAVIIGLSKKGGGGTMG